MCNVFETFIQLITQLIECAFSIYIFSSFFKSIYTATISINFAKKHFFRSNPKTSIRVFGFI